MLINIDLRSGKSLNEQIVLSIKNLIITEVLKPDEKLPSVRELASTLTINPNTIQKAYKELEREGFIYSIKGKGSFVMAKDIIKNESKVSDLMNEILFNFEKAKFLDIRYNRILKLLDEVYSLDGGKIWYRYII